MSKFDLQMFNKSKQQFTSNQTAYKLSVHPISMFLLLKLNPWLLKIDIQEALPFSEHQNFPCGSSHVSLSLSVFTVLLWFWDSNLNIYWYVLNSIGKSFKIIAIVFHYLIMLIYIGMVTIKTTVFPTIRSMVKVAS